MVVIPEIHRLAVMGHHYGRLVAADIFHVQTT